MTSRPVERYNEKDANSQRPGPLLAALGEVDRLHDLFHEASHFSSSDDIFSEEDCMLTRQFSKQEELVSCLLKMKNLMEEAELESMRLKEEKKLLTKRIGESLITVNAEMDNLRQQLKEQDKKLKELGASPVIFSSNHERSTTGISALVSEQTEQIILLQKQLIAYEHENSELRKKMPLSEQQFCQQCKRLQEYAAGLEIKIQKYKETFTSLRRERKQLRSEKLELLDQLRQLYSTLEDKEKELRDFILNYEEKARNSEETIQSLLAEKERIEKERWDLLKCATENSQRCLNLKNELDNTEEILRKKDEELKNTEEELERINQGSSKDGGLFEFFGLFGKEISPKTKLTSEERIGEQMLYDTNEHTDSVSNQTADVFSFRNDAPYSTHSTKHRQEDAAINKSLERASPLLACSTPVPTSSETQYLSLGETGTTHNDLISSHSQMQSPTVSDKTELVCSNSSLPEPPVTRHKSPVVRRSSSLKRKEMMKKSPRHERYNKVESPRQSEDAKEKPILSNGNVIKRQGSMNRRPKTFHSDFMDIAPIPSPNSEPEEPRSPKRKTLTDTISRIFGRDKDKTPGSPSKVSDPKARQEDMFDKWNIWDSIQRIPMALWKARDVVVWLEIECAMPMYTKNCSQYIKSGRVLLQLANEELTSLLGITNQMHKLKLKLAIDDHRYPDRRIPSLSKLDHVWISHTWLKDLGLSQYSVIFENNLVDGRMINNFNKRDLEKHFGMTKKLHQASFMCGIHLLKKLNFDKESLELRRANCMDSDIDMIVWTNERVIQWALSIDLKEHAHRLRDTGVHGAFIVFDETFTIDTMATALGIQPGRNTLYRHLTSELSPILKSSRSKLGADDRLKSGKLRSGGLSRSFSLRWSRRERPKKIPSSCSTGNINGESSSKESIIDNKPTTQKGPRHATLL